MPLCTIKAANPSAHRRQRCIKRRLAPAFLVRLPCSNRRAGHHGGGRLTGRHVADRRQQQPQRRQRATLSQQLCRTNRIA